MNKNKDIDTIAIKFLHLLLHAKSELGYVVSEITKYLIFGMWNIFYLAVQLWLKKSYIFGWDFGTIISIIQTSFPCWNMLFYENEMERDTWGWGWGGHCWHYFPGARPTNDISIEFAIRPKYAVLWFKMHSTDHNEI